MLARMSNALPPAAAFLKHTLEALQQHTLVEIRLQPAGQPPVTVRPIDLREGAVLSFVTHEPRRDLTCNRDHATAQAELERLLASATTAWLRTNTKAWQLVATPGKRARLVPHAAPPNPVPSRAHDRPKHHHLDSAQAWLHALDLTDERGRPRPGRSDKLRQIERYADLLGHLIRDAGWTAGQALTLADMGCGKGYLTFAAWQLLRRNVNLQARVIGLDAQAGVVAAAQEAAVRVQAEGLSFAVGTIADAVLPSVDVLIALHACNDATDHAILRGVAAGARVIVVAPCCHKDVRRVLGTPAPIAPLLHHGLFKERFAEWLTDGLRALALEAAGYRVTVAEFVDASHTPKNVLIGAVKGNSPERQAAARAEFLALKQWAGLGELAVDALAG